ncbi:head GIN domain-containing protein [Maribellus maritimus]|uniref:head GIN domain-containing protein n=1 Tax=Maribellus maritimus TaxID=2870838 RepID=UPI001EEA70E9|nr:head GIN domain-containing protein [Maribellus maritimus]MCG6186353.1 DUF2807 domain-containing protein [Maribellus maritimus]
MKLLGLISAFILVVFSNVGYAQNDDDWESRTYDLSEFNEIKLEGGYRVFLIQGDENSLLVRASDDDVFDYLKIGNSTESLRLKIDREHFNFDRINLYITFKELERVDIEGGVKLKTKGYLDLNDFSMHVEGGAKIELDMKAEDVRIIGEGGVLFELSGVAETLDVHVSGAGHIDASELKTKDVTFKVEGVGTGSVYATDNLYAKIEGVGKIKYRGHPEVTKDIEGLGSVTSN